LLIDDPDIIERAVVLEVVGDGDGRRVTQTELERVFFDVEPAAIGAAIERLREGGVVQVSGEEVWASPCAVHLNGLGMICV